MSKWPKTGGNSWTHWRKHFHLHSWQYLGALTCGRSAPQGRGAFYRLPVEGDGARLLHGGAALVHEVLHHLLVPVPAAQHQRGCPVSLGWHQSRYLLSRPVVQENLKWRLCLEYFIQIIDSSFVDSLSTYHYLIRVRFEAFFTGKNFNKNYSTIVQKQVLRPWDRVLNYNYEFDIRYRYYIGATK